jgi:hypothetical protein
VASPDTDELATVPLPAGPEAETAPEPGAEQAGAAAETVPQERVEPERVPPEAAPVASPAAKDGGRWWRGFTGSVTAGLVILAAGVLAVGGICLYTGAPGPGATPLIGHPIAAVLAVLAQRVADRRNGLPAAGAGIAVMLFAISALTLFWLT